MSETRVCGWQECDKPVVVGGHGRPRKFCSRSCRQRSYELERARKLLGKLAGQSATPSIVSDESASGAGGSSGVDLFGSDESRPGPSIVSDESTSGAGGSSGVDVFGSDESPAEPLTPPAPVTLADLSPWALRPRRPYVVRFADLSPDRQQWLGDRGWSPERFEEYQREEQAKDPEVDPLRDFFLPGQ